jgi:hypothetical protein
MSLRSILGFINISLAEVKEYNFLGNIIDNKGTFKRSAQELSKKGLKAFFMRHFIVVIYNSAVL